MNRSVLLVAFCVAAVLLSGTAAARRSSTISVPKASHATLKAPKVFHTTIKVPKASHTAIKVPRIPK